MRRFLGIFLLLGLGACSLEPFEKDEARLGYDYFPLEGGRYWEYTVVRTQYRIDKTIAQDTFQVRWQLEDTLLWTEEVKQMELVSYSLSSSGAWQEDSLWIAERRPNQLILTRGTISTIVLAFPPQTGLQWNGYALQSAQEQLFEVTNSENIFQYDTLTYTPVLEVLQRNYTDNVTGEDDYREIFQKGVGLVYSEKNKTIYCSQEDCRGQQIIEFGERLHYILTAHGKEE
ncbi:hypothetical protein QWY31_00980 [Cytophagales bacterium LB-30]|uniref:Lipoprotein n=1 Tax=Shiella aurantiaca TaxID=3058365 RepID=A0ABT8F1C9_9BACT|nr:hypothetical protein [Shiella aurantiaca]MDN4164049.1 hypothetical protein [Shiella aurantiaca]